MQKQLFAGTGLHVSPLGYGGASVSDQPDQQADVLRVIHALLDAGVNVIDTAQCYAGSEAFIGRELGSRRDQFVLISKCGHHRVLEDGSLRSRVISMADIDQALTRLRTEHLDVMLLHSYDFDLLKQGDAIDVLVKARQAGKIRFAGYSGDNDAAAWAAAHPEIAVVETSVNIADQSNIDTVVSVAKQHGVGVIAKRPIANAAWRELDTAPETYAKMHHRSYIERLQAMRLEPEKLGIEGEPGQAWPELALRFTISIEGVHTAIVGTRSLSNAKANLAAVNKGPLPLDVIGSIRDAFRRAERRAGEPWRGEN